MPCVTTTHPGILWARARHTIGVEGILWGNGGSGAGILWHYFINKYIVLTYRIVSGRRRRRDKVVPIGSDEGQLIGSVAIPVAVLPERRVVDTAAASVVSASRDGTRLTGTVVACVSAL
eukprot:COSAG02_NODE_2387_length_8986_cov_12.395184_12_plen_119_part_00